MQGGIIVDPKASILWKKIENEEEGIEPTNWLSLKYKSKYELELSGSGNNGLEEARDKVFKKNEITFCIVLGCQKRGKKHLELVRIVFLWIPKGVSPLKKARAIMDIDEVVCQLELDHFCLLGADRKGFMKGVVEKVSNIRGGQTTNPGRYYFDENVTKLRTERYERLKNGESISQKKVEEFRRKETHVLRELFSTERHYIRCLEILKDKYVEPLKTHGHVKEYSTVFSMVNTITTVNKEYYESLRKIYSILPSDDCDDEKKFTKKLNELDESYFTTSKISSILDVSQKHFKTFQFYGPYVCNYQRMVNSVSTLLIENEELHKHYEKSRSELQSKGVRNTDFQSFLIMPIQRIPRYELLFRELGKYIDPSLSEKIKVVQKDLKKLGSVVNENKENMMKASKTIEAAKFFQRPELMDQKMLKFRNIEILDRKKLQLLEQKSSMKDEASSIKGKPGELLIYENVILIIKLKKGGGFLSSMVGFLRSDEYQQLQQQQPPPQKKKKKKKKTDQAMLRMKLKYEFSLKNPNVRCNKHVSSLDLFDILDLEDETLRVSLKMKNVEECEDTMFIIQQQLSHHFGGHSSAMRSLFSSRVIYKSWMETQYFTEELQNNMVKKRFFFVIRADLKMEMFENEEFVHDDKDDSNDPVLSYSLIGAKKYGLTSRKEMDSFFLSTSAASARTTTSSTSEKSNVNKVRSNSVRKRIMRMEKKDEKYWFYIIFSSSFSDGEDDDEEEKKKNKGGGADKKIFFQAVGRQMLEIWMMILDRNIGFEDRLDEENLPVFLGEDEDDLTNQEEELEGEEGDNQEEEFKVIEIDGFYNPNNPNSVQPSSTSISSSSSFTGGGGVFMFGGNTSSSSSFVPNWNNQATTTITTTDEPVPRMDTPTRVKMREVMMSDLSKLMDNKNN